MRSVVASFVLALAACIPLRPASAAHAGAPYANVNHRNDAGNNTGDAEVDRLNGAQLNSEYYRTHPAPPPDATIVVPGR